MKQIRTLKGIISQELPFVLSVPAILWQVLFLYIPLAVLLYVSLHKAIDVSLLAISFKNYLALFDFSHFRVIGRSIFLAAGTAFLCLLGAYPVAYFLALKVRRFKNVLLFLLTLPFWTNFLIQVYSWFFILDRNGFINTFLLKMGIIHEPLCIANNFFAVFLVMVYCYLPFMIMPIYSILEKIERSVLEASIDLGATHWQTFTRITLPLSVSGIKVGVLLVLVPAFGEFAIPALIGGSKYMMVGSLISYYFLVARDVPIGAAFTIVSGFILLLVAYLFNRYFRVSDYTQG